MGMLAGLFQDTPPRASESRVDAAAACTRRSCPPTTRRTSPRRRSARPRSPCRGRPRPPPGARSPRTASGGTARVCCRPRADDELRGPLAGVRQGVHPRGRCARRAWPPLGSRADDGLDERVRRTGAAAPYVAAPAPASAAVGRVGALPETTWQWQITGTVDATVAAQMYDVDLFDARPGEDNGGVDRSPARRGVVVDLLPRYGRLGELPARRGAVPALRDRQLDGLGAASAGSTSAGTRGRQFAPIIWAAPRPREALGCDGVEPDQNNPIGNRPGFPITPADQKAWYLEVARQAHPAASRSG